MPVVTAAAAPSTGGGTEDASATAVDVKATATNMDPRRWSVLSMHATKAGPEYIQGAAAGGACEWDVCARERQNPTWGNV